MSEWKKLETTVQNEALSVRQRLIEVVRFCLKTDSIVKDAMRKIEYPIGNLVVAVLDEIQSPTSTARKAATDAAYRDMLKECVDQAIGLLHLSAIQVWNALAKPELRFVDVNVNPRVYIDTPMVEVSGSLSDALLSTISKLVDQTDLVRVEVEIKSPRDEDVLELLLTAKGSADSKPMESRPDQDEFADLREAGLDVRVNESGEGDGESNWTANDPNMQAIVDELNDKPENEAENASFSDQPTEVVPDSGVEPGSDSNPF